MISNIEQQTSPQNVVVVGLGKSGMAAAQFLKNQGYRVTVTDIDPAKNEIALALKAAGIHTEIGFHNRSTFEHADLIVKSPGIPMTGAHFEAAIERKIPIRGEMDLACEYIDVPIVAITGTNGKTTVTTLVGEMLKASGKKVFVGGNIGTPLISYVHEGQNADIVVLEVSSFQLDTAHNFSPDVAVLLNITEDHLNRYPDFDAYKSSKWSIFRNQRENGVAIINGALDKDSEQMRTIESQIHLFNTKDVDTKKILSRKNPSIHMKKLPFDMDQLIKISKTGLMGKHNRENIEAAAMAALCAGGTIEGIKTAIIQFKALPHRTQYVATINGVTFYNDSKATNVDAVIRAIESIEIPIILIMGGEEKDTDFSPLIPWVQDKVKQVVLMGETKDKIKETLTRKSKTVARSSSSAPPNLKMTTGLSSSVSENVDGHHPAMVMVDTMASAVAQAFDAASSGDTVLFSPACASFDMYNSYAHRGDDFMEKVKQLKQRQ